MGRYDRQHRDYSREPSPDDSDPREHPQRDRDRVLYTPPFRRLGGVTQVAGASEGHTFHNRLTHSLKAGQIARRLAEKYRREVKGKDSAAGLGAYRDEIHPEVAEAAALAHDLGHPPFGHVAEETLDELVREGGVSDGYEGNAQSFRILTKLAPHRHEYEGLDLTRATLNAVLKYPWLRGEAAQYGYPAKKDRGQKFGAYTTEVEALTFAREESRAEGQQSVEAAIMDHSDDIAYSVHDVADFYRAGLIPLDRLLDHGVFDAFIAQWRASDSAKVSDEEIEEHQEMLWDHLNAFAVLEAPYDGSYEDRVALNTMTSNLIDHFFTSGRLVPPDHKDAPLQVEPEKKIQMRFWQALVWHYVIATPRLATQREGQRKVVTRLWECYFDAIDQDRPAVLPERFQLLYRRWREEATDDLYPARLAADIVASFTDGQALTIYRRLIGVSAGSVTDPLDL